MIGFLLGIISGLWLSMLIENVIEKKFKKEREQIGLEVKELERSNRLP